MKWKFLFVGVVLGFGAAIGVHLLTRGPSLATRNAFTEGYYHRREVINELAKGLGLRQIFGAHMRSQGLGVHNSYRMEWHDPNVLAEHLLWSTACSSTIEVTPDPGETAFGRLMSGVFRLTAAQDLLAARAGLHPVQDSITQEGALEDEAAEFIVWASTMRYADRDRKQISETRQRIPIRSDAERITWWRHYLSLENGGTLALGKVLRPGSTTVEITLVWSDRSICDVEYPGGTFEKDDNVTRLGLDLGD